MMMVKSRGKTTTFGERPTTLGEQPTTFGEQRVFGVMGFGLGNFVSGLAVEHYTGKGSPYVATFYVFLPYIILLVPAGMFLFYVV